MVGECPVSLELKRHELMHSKIGTRISSGTMLITFIAATGKTNPLKFKLEFMVWR